MDETDSTAKSIGAVNTILNDEGKLVGFNTDGIGAMRALKENGVSLEGKKLLLLRAGGAGKAIGFLTAQEVNKIERRYGTEAVARAFVTMVFSEIRAFLQDSAGFMGKKIDRQDFEAVTWVIYLLGKQFKAAELSRAMNLIQLAGREIGELFNRYDVVLLPTLAKPPIKIGELKITGLMDITMKLMGQLRCGWILKQAVNMNFKMLSDMFFSFIPYTPMFNATGQPAMSIPLCWNDAGLPIGMQFVGNYGDEATLFRLAGQLEKARPWAGRIPPVCVPAAP